MGSPRTHLGEEGQTAANSFSFIHLFKTTETGNHNNLKLFALKQSSHLI